MRLHTWFAIFAFIVGTVFLWLGFLSLFGLKLIGPDISVDMFLAIAFFMWCQVLGGVPWA